MPEKTGKKRERTQQEKEADAKLIEEMKAENGDQEIPFDPLEAQAEALPASIKGSEGNRSHVMNVGEDGEVVGGGEFFEEDEPLGGGVGDASKLTAD